MQSTMAQLNEQAKLDMQQMMQTAISAIASQNTNVASQTNDVLIALEKVEDRKRKLEFEISLSTNDDDKSKKFSIAAKLDQKSRSFVSHCDVFCLPLWTFFDLFWQFKPREWF